jgi:hypothetical protein
VLGAGDVTRSPFANTFLRIFVSEESLGHALPDPCGSQSNIQRGARAARHTDQWLSLRLGAGLAPVPASLARRAEASEVVVLAPRLHPGITQEVAPNESQRAPKPLLCGASAVVSVREGLKGRWFKSSPAMNDEGLADARAANPFAYPDFTQESVWWGPPRTRPSLLRRA